jgi:hypothetical protein
MVERFFRGTKVLQRLYTQEHRPVIGWDWMPALGLLVGALLPALLSGSFSPRWVPAFWEETFGDTPLLRIIPAFFGGMLLGIGSRWAGGCTKRPRHQWSFLSLACWFLHSGGLGVLGCGEAIRYTKRLCAAKWRHQAASRTAQRSSP